MKRWLLSTTLATALTVTALNARAEENFIERFPYSTLQQYGLVVDSNAKDSPFSLGFEYNQEVSSKDFYRTTVVERTRHDLFSESEKKLNFAEGTTGVKNSLRGLAKYDIGEPGHWKIGVNFVRFEFDENSPMKGLPAHAQKELGIDSIEDAYETQIYATWDF